MNHFSAKTLFDQRTLGPTCEKVAPPPEIDGETCEEKLDGPRLRKQLERVREYALAIFPKWKTAAEIAAELERQYEPTKFPEPSVGARLRDLRKEKFGHYTVRSHRREDGGGSYEYLVYPKDGLI